MACVSGTNIVNDGLVFHFDLENGVKSFKGKPTSNLAPNTDYFNRVYNQEYDISSWGGDEGYAIYYPNGGWNNLPYKRITKTADGSGGSYINEHSSFTLEEGKTYTISCYMRSDRTQTHNGHLLALNRSSTNTYFVPSNITLSTDWERKTWTHTVAEGDGSSSYLFRQIVYTDMPTDVYWCALQIEEGTLATKYVNGVRFDTASIVDLSPNKNTITAANLTYRQDDTPTFDGANDYLETSLANYSNNEISIDAWFKLFQTSGTKTIIGRGALNTDDEIDLIFGYSDPFRLVGRFAGAGSQTSYPWSSENDNIWKNSVMTVKDIGSDRVNSLYIDGVLVDSVTTSRLISSYSGQFDIGRLPLSGRYFDGEISQVKIYDKALTEAEVKQNFEAVRTRYGI